MPQFKTPAASLLIDSSNGFTACRLLSAHRHARRHFRIRAGCLHPYGRRAGCYSRRAGSRTGFLIAIRWDGPFGRFHLLWTTITALIAAGVIVALWYNTPVALALGLLFAGLLGSVGCSAG